MREAKCFFFISGSLVCPFACSISPRVWKGNDCCASHLASSSLWSPLLFFLHVRVTNEKKYEKIKSCYESLQTWLVSHWATGICSISQLDWIVPCGLAMVACCKLFPQVKVIRVCSHSLRLNDNSHRIILRGWCLKRTSIIPNKKVANSDWTKLDAQLNHASMTCNAGPPQ